MIEIEFSNKQNNNITIHNVKCRAIYTGCGKNSTRITFSSERLLDPEKIEDRLDDRSNICRFACRTV